MNPELKHHISAASRLIYFVTEEEDRFLNKLYPAVKKKENVLVYNSTMGLHPIETLVQDWTNRAHPKDKDTMSIHDALEKIYKDSSSKGVRYYVILDPERWLKDQQVQRRILNILHQCHQNNKSVKVMICVSNTRAVPSKLSRYTEVVQDTGLTTEDIQEAVANTCKPMNLDPPEESVKLFNGMTSFEIQASLMQSYRKTKGGIDPKFVSDYRLRQLKKTDLVQYVDTSGYSFDQVGGADRLKKWVEKIKVAWTEEGKDFGLEPPKGLMAIGVWGTGKSLSMKCLANAWGIPILALDMGKLRQSGVGDSEANVYRACMIIESMAPCIVWVDEAEKSLSGGESSARTDGGTTSRMIGAFSTWHQETTAEVCLAYTANSLKGMPVEIVNRTDERWFFELPTQEDRIEILKIHLKKRGQDPGKFKLLELAKVAHEMVGREIEQAIKAAMVDSFVAGHKTLDGEILKNQLINKPRIATTMGDEIHETLDWVGYDPERDDGVKARFASTPDRKGPDLSLR